MSGGVVLQAVLSGLAVGAVYGLVAMGFTLVHGLTRTYALAHGDVVVGAAFVGVLAVVGTTPVARDLGVAASAGLAATTVVAAAALSALVYLVAMRPFMVVPGAGGRRRGTAPGPRGEAVGWVAGAIAAGLAVRAVLGLAFTRQAYAVPDPLHLSALTDSGVVALPDGASVQVRVFAVLLIGVIVAVAGQWMLERGRVGLALRAASDDAETASLLGVPVHRLVLVAFAVAGALAGVAAMLYAPSRPLSVDAGVVLGLKGVAAAALGRFGSLRGALAGGVALGVAEQLVVAWPPLGASYVDVFPLGLLVVLLALRPEGLRGRVREPVE